MSKNFFLYNFIMAGGDSERLVSALLKTLRGKKVTRALLRQVVEAAAPPPPPNPNAASNKKRWDRRKRARVAAGPLPNLSRMDASFHLTYAKLDNHNEPYEFESLNSYKSSSKAWAYAMKTHGVTAPGVILVTDYVFLPFMRHLSTDDPSAADVIAAKLNYL